jgi:hypothetical protein
MTDGDYYRTYAATRLACGSPNTNLVIDTELDELQKDADAIIHEYLDVDAKQTRRPNVLAKVESDLVLQGIIRLRMAKENNMAVMDFMRRLGAGEGGGGVFDQNPQLTKAHMSILDKWLMNLHTMTIDSTDREDDHE